MSKISLITRDIAAPAKDDPTRKAYYYKYEVLAPAKLFGKRIRKKFKTKAEANNCKQQMEIKLQNQRLTPLDRDIHLCAARFQKLLTVGQMEDALSKAVVYHEQSDIDLKTMSDEYVERLEKRHQRGHVGKLHLKLHQRTAPRLVEWLGNIKLREITKKMCEDFIDDRIAEGLAPRTARNYAEVLGAVLKQAVDEGLLTKHPMVAVDMPASNTPVHILTPDELNKLLSAAGQIFKEHDIMTPRIMFGAFAGLRTSEIERLTWEDVRLDLGQLYVSPGKTKNAERWVVLTPPLLDWCEKMLGSGATGLVLRGPKSNCTPCFHTVSRHKKKLREAAGVEIPHNALRHSYGSHHLVQYDKPNATAIEMGHHSPQMTFKAYRKAVTKVQAAAYWDIRSPI